MGGLPKKPKIQAYVDDRLHDHFQDYCQQRRLNQSKGLEQLLASFFKAEIPDLDLGEDYQSQQISAELADLKEQISLIQQQIELHGKIISEKSADSLADAEEKSAQISKQIKEALGVFRLELLKELPNIPAWHEENSLESANGLAPESLEELPELAAIESAESIDELAMQIPQELPGGLLPIQGHSQRALGKRLGKSGTAIGKHVLRGDLLEWSRSLDPDQVGWRFDEEWKLYFPMGEAAC